MPHADRRTTLVLAAVLAVLWAPVPALPAEDREPGILGGPVWVTAKFLDSEAPRPPVIFAGACSKLRHYKEPVRVVLIMPAGRKQGYIVEVHDDPEGRVVSNLGEVRFSRDAAEVWDNHGGVGTTNTLRVSGKKIANVRMSAFSSYRRALSQRPTMKCPPDML